jgi:hypothetical protein
MGFYQKLMSSGIQKEIFFSRPILDQTSEDQMYDWYEYSNMGFYQKLMSSGIQKEIFFF